MCLVPESLGTHPYYIYYTVADVDVCLVLVQRAVEWLVAHQPYSAFKVPADLAPIICPGSGKGEGA